MNNICDLDPQLHRALSSTSYIGKTRKDDTDVFMLNSFLKDINTNGTTDKVSKPNIFLEKDFLKELSIFFLEINLRTIYKVRERNLIYHNV